MKITVEVNLLERVVGVPEVLEVEGIKTSEPLMVSVGTATTVGVVRSARENRADMALKIPVVAEPGQRVAVSRRIGGKWRLIGYGVLKYDRARASRFDGFDQVGLIANPANRRASPTFSFEPWTAIR